MCIECIVSSKNKVGNIFDLQISRYVNLMNTMQEAYSGVGCEVLCCVLQIVGEGVAWECRTWSTLVGCYKVFSLDGITHDQMCDQDNYYLQNLHH